MIIFIVAISVFLINLPFGYWRSKVKKFSPQWFLAIHLPVPFVILLRIYSNIGFEFYTYPILIGSFFLGQFFGKNINSKIFKIFKLKKRFLKDSIFQKILSSEYVIKNLESFVTSEVSVFYS
ncbi:MAG: hypothetical protein IPH62_03375 [Ignavibacteriae bacterium]|nr:hypothetical protein [Ignavibacteriota bacterium]